MKCVQHLPIPLSFAGLGALATLDFSSFAESPVRVFVEGERENVLARGPRCVSLSSASRSSVSRKLKRGGDHCSQDKEARR